MKFADTITGHFSASASAKPNDAAAPYVGGEVRSRVHGASDAHVGIGFSSGGIKESNDSALNVLSTLLSAHGNTQLSNYVDAGIFSIDSKTSDPRGFISKVAGRMKVSLLFDFFFLR